MLQRLSWPGATRWQQMSALFSWATLFSFLLIYVVFYGLAFFLVYVAPASLDAHLTFLSPIVGFAPQGAGSFDPADIVSYGLAFPFKSEYYIIDPRLIGTLLFCLPLFCATIAWITGTVDMLSQRRWWWAGISVASGVFAILNATVISGILHVLHIGAGSFPQLTLHNMVFWIAAIEELIVLYVPWLVVTLYLSAVRSQRQRTREIALTVLASLLLASLSLIFATTTGPLTYSQEGSTLSYFTAGFPLPFVFNFPALSTFSVFVPLYLLDVMFFYACIAVAKIAVGYLRKRLPANAQRTGEVGTNPL